MIEISDKECGVLIFDDNRVTTSVGRNGTYTTIGVDIFSDDEEITMSGITSKNTPAKGDICIPKNDIPQLIQILNNFL